MQYSNESILTIIITCLLVGATILLSGCMYKIPENPDTYIRTLIYDDLERSFRIHIPSNLSLDDNPPLVLILHGGTGTGDGMERSLTLGGFNDLSDEYGFVAVYPDGIERHWNDGRTNVSDLAHQQDLDDVGFLSALIDNLTVEFNIDTKRVFATGISNGAMMSFRLAVELPDKIAAIAPVAGALPVDQIGLHNSSIPVSVCVISGTHDPLVPWDGGMVGTKRNPRGEVISVPDTVQYWVKYDHCDDTPNSSILPDVDKRDRTRVYLDRYCDGLNGTEVVLYRIQNGGHTWPGGYQYYPKILIGRTCRDIDANVIIWDFFNNHPRLE